MDVSSVHHGGTLLRYFVSLLGYGFYGDLIKDSEKKRWMGLVRYDFSGDPLRGGEWGGRGRWGGRIERPEGRTPGAAAQRSGENTGDACLLSLPTPEPSASCLQTIAVTTPEATAP